MIYMISRSTCAKAIFTKHGTSTAIIYYFVGRLALDFCLKYSKNAVSAFMFKTNRHSGHVSSISGRRIF